MKPGEPTKPDHAWYGTFREDGDDELARLKFHVGPQNGVEPDDQPEMNEAEWKPSALRNLPGRQLPLARLYHVDPAPIPWLPTAGQPGFFVRGAVNLLAADGGAGKTDLLFSSVLDWIEQGVESAYLGPKMKPYNRPLDVVWFTEENAALWQRRVQRYATNPKWLYYIKAVSEIRETAAMMNWLNDHYEWWAYAKGIRPVPDVIVLDTFRSLIGMEDENQNSEVARALQPWIDLQRQTGCTLVVNHHMRKSGGKRSEGIAGAAAFVDVVDQSLTLGYPDDDPDGHGSERVLKTAKVRYEEEGTPRAGNYQRVQVTANGWETGKYRMEWIGTRAKTTIEDRVREVIGPTPVSRAFIESEVGGSRSQVSAAIASLVAKGELAKVGNGPTTMFRQA